jgi:AraC-like DNA-binding protein
MKRKTFLYRAVEFVAEGRGTLRMGGQKMDLVPGMVFSYRPGIPHEIRSDPDEPMLKYFIDFTGRESDALLNNTRLSEGPVQVSEPNRIRALMDEIQETANSSEGGASDICLLLLKLILLKVDALATQAPFVHSRSMHSYERCKKLIDEGFMTLNGLDEIAKACHMDAATICRLFKRFGDSTPYRYLMQLKMRHAADRLQNSNILVKEAASEMGFDDPYHFSRSFKKVHGISPQRFLELTSRIAT